MQLYMNSTNNGATEMYPGLPGGRVDAHYNGIGFVKISGIFLTQDNFFGAISLDRGRQCPHYWT